MGIESLEIKGFRSLRNVRWEPGRLNVLIGPNGSGKSNLLDACMLLQEAVLGQLEEGIIRRGGLAPLLWDQREGTSWELTDDALIYGLTLQRLGQTGMFRIAGEQLSSEGHVYLSRTPAKARFIARDGNDFIWKDDLSESQTFLYTAAAPLGSLAAVVLQDKLDTWSIYDSLQVGRESTARQASVTRVEQQISRDGQNLTPVLHTLYTGNREFRRSVDAAMTAAFGDDYEELLFPPAADQRVQLRLRWRSLKTEQSAANLSDGTLRFLILVAILANPEPGDLIAIDEPEAGLHPRMLSILAELAQEASERTQVVFTTHSPQFLDGFTGEPPTTTVAEWSDGETRLTNVDGEELRRWLQKYSLGSLFRSGELEALA